MKAIKEIWDFSQTTYLERGISKDYGGIMQKVVMNPVDYLSSEKKEEYFHSLNKKNVNLFNELLESSKGIEEKTAVEDPFMKMDYKTLIISCYVLGEKIEKGLKNDESIGVLLPTSVVHVLTLFSIFKAGKTPALLNSSMGIKSILDCIDSGQLKTVITSKSFVEKGGFELLIKELEKTLTVLYIEDLKAAISQSDKAKGYIQYQIKKQVKASRNELILFTSGSETKPKGVVLSHGNIYANIYQIFSMLPFYAHDKVFNALPMFHSFGLTTGTLFPLLTKLSVFLYPTPLHFKEIPAVVFNSHSTILFGTSTFLEKYEKAAKKHHFSSLRFVVAGGERLKPEVRDAYLIKSAVRILEGYGCTEAAPVICFNALPLYKTNTVGMFLPGVQYKIVPVEGISEGGRLLIKGPNVMKGYLQYEQGFIPAPEWYDTGDVVKQDEDGCITVLSRLKRFAKLSGEMVSLNLVEQIAAKCYQRTDFYAVCVPDATKGERIVLFTTFNEIEAAKLKKYVKIEQLSQMNIPHTIENINSVPLLGSGKVDYVTLTQQAKILFTPKI